ncbi:MAG: hypothetical protein JNL48_20135 [Acidobacteria bacterium]|nr:hypothetical protein [Acidobacteriota bacterium]
MPTPGRTRFISRALTTGALLALAVWTAACGGDAPAAVAAPTAADIEWREIGSWSGSAGRQTESFEVSMTAMRLRWKTMREKAPGTGRFTVTLHSAVSGRPIQTLVEARGEGADTVTVAEEPRWSHFVVDATDVDWEMTLEQGYLRTR